MGTDNRDSRALPSCLSGWDPRLTRASKPNTVSLGGLQQGKQDEARMQLEQVSNDLFICTQEQRAMSDDPIPALYERLAPAAGLR